MPSADAPKVRHESDSEFLEARFSPIPLPFCAYEAILQTPTVSLNMARSRTRITMPNGIARDNEQPFASWIASG